MIENRPKKSTNKGKFAIPVVLLFGVFAGAVIVLQTKGIGATLLQDGKKILVPVASEPDSDPDNDGLKNWEEEVYKTDPRNPDTDEDGYSDGEEVASGYDPTIPAPDDALADTDTSVPRPAPKNLTDNLSQIISDKIASGEIKPISDPNTASDSALLENEAILNEALAQISEKAKKDFALPVISDSEIKISRENTTPEQVQRYIVQMGSAMTSTDDSVYAGFESETALIKTAVEKKDTSKVQPLIDSYAKNIENIKQIEVPQDFSDIHKQQIAIFELTKKILEAIRDFQDDPASASAAADVYPKLNGMLQDLSEKLVSRLEKYQQ